MAWHLLEMPNSIVYDGIHVAGANRTFGRSFAGHACCDGGYRTISYQARNCAANPTGTLCALIFEAPLVVTELFSAL